MLERLRRLLQTLLAKPPHPVRDIGGQLGDLLAALAEAGLEPTARELEEALWLARHLGDGAKSQANDRHEQVKPNEPKPPPSQSDNTATGKPPRRSPEYAQNPVPEAEAAVYPRSRLPGGSLAARPFRAPRVANLPNALELGRALRPLQRRVASRTRWRLDENATVERLAESSMAGHCVWAPVRERLRERWLDVSLVLDCGDSMQVWQPLLAELRQLLAYHGAFRSVRVYRLETQSGKVRLSVGDDPSLARHCWPRELESPDGRRMVWVVSDCISPAWHTGEVGKMLEPLTQTNPTAILQLLPERMWRGTALGRGREIRLGSAAPGAPTVLLPLLDPRVGEAPSHALRLPVVTLEPEALADWAWLLAGRGGSSISAIEFSANTRYEHPAIPADAASPTPEAIARRLERFYRDASPLAQQLAGYLAAAPLTLPVMRLIQQTLLPLSRQTQLAEVFVSGLLRKLPELAEADDDPFFDFHPGLRERLLDHIGIDEAADVLRRVSAFVAHRTGGVIDFHALLADPEATGDLRLLGNARYFARLGATVLRRFGGDYLDLADRLQGSTGFTRNSHRVAGEAPTAPTPFRDLFLTRMEDGSLVKDATQPGPAMVWLPSGTFLMGSPEGVGYDSEHPQHAVTLDHYAVGQYPVTVGEFRRFVEATGYQTEAERGDGAYVWDKKGEWKKTQDASWKKPYFEQTEKNPVVCLSWNDAKAYCDWLIEKTGQAYGLLTEAQWEHACRAGSNARYCYGDDEAGLGEYAWYSNNAKAQTHPVGKRKPNAWQLYDMHGNVWEWCADWWANDYYQQFTSKPQHPASASEQSASGSASGREQIASKNPNGPASENPSGPASGSLRVVRGGSWNFVAVRCRSAYRFGNDPSIRNGNLGFRLSRTGPLPSYPFTLGPVESEKPALPEFIAGLRDPLNDGTEGPAMVWLSGGEFIMGQDDSSYDDEKPAHPVRVDAVSIGQYPVTFEEYDRFCSATKRESPDDRSWGRGDRPAINVSWGDAQAYCEWLGQQTGEHYRLATEAEWEYACRAGSTTRYCYGDDEAGLGDYAWYSNNAKAQTHPVGKRKPNAWQLYDMHGNVLEWCADWWSSDYYQQFMSKPQHPASDSEQSASGSASGREQIASKNPNGPASENPSGPASGSIRVVRGGSWGSGADGCRSAYRSGYDPSFRGHDLGFRLSRTGPWRSYPITLGAAQLLPPVAEEANPVESESLPTTKPRFQPYAVFHDRLASEAKQGQGPAMVYLPGGEFLMGDEKGGDDEKPVHAVRLNAFAMGRAPVTWAEYRRFCESTQQHWPEWLEQGNEYHLETGKNDYYPKRGVSRDGLDLPVVGISWEDARAYCQWLSGQTGETYALPTEAQWEYACRAGNPGRWCFGDDETQLAEYAWFSGNAGGKLHPVMNKAANYFGLYDVHGNVWEWCADWYASDYYTLLAGHSQHTASANQQSASENPSGPASGSIRVVRGGSWINVADNCRSAYRDLNAPSGRSYSLGFRLSRTV